MAETSATDKTAATAPVASAEEASTATAPAPASDAKVMEEKKLVVRDDTGKVEEKISKMEVKDDAEEPKEPEAAEKPSKVASEEKLEENENMPDADETDAKDAAAEVEAEVEAEVDIDVDVDVEADTTIAADTPAAPSTSSKNKNRRKSTGDSKAKTLNKKGSKVRLTHLDAQPGEHFLVKLKGFPAWPAIICDEAMLPHALVSSRPVSAARPDGSYAEAYAEGGKRVHDRTFPVMYLYTNEFGWVVNTALTSLTAEKARETITEKMRKDLKAAFELAIEQNSIEHYKDILVSFQEELIAQEEARKEAAATPKKSKKSKAAKVSSNEYDDVEMADADEAVKPKAKKRKAEEDTPQRPESVKKPKIKLNTSSTPKPANGTPSAKAKEAAASKTAKGKTKKGKEAGEKKSEAPKEAKMTPEERHARKEREVMYLRHKIQRGLLTREQPPKAEEMGSMSEHITILENIADLEVSIIRATKINKVLKAILKLDTIPREEEYGFKKRSQALLDKWNKLLASDGSAGPAAAATGTAPSNGVNGSAEADAAGKEKEKEEEKDTETKSGANGVEEGAKSEAEKASGDAAASASGASKAEEKEKELKGGEEAEKEEEKEKVDEEMS